MGLHRTFSAKYESNSKCSVPAAGQRESKTLGPAVQKPKSDSNSKCLVPQRNFSPINRNGLRENKTEGKGLLLMSLKLPFSCAHNIDLAWPYYTKCIRLVCLDFPEAYFHGIDIELLETAF